MTPYTCLFIDTGDHCVLVDTGAGDFLGAHAAEIFPGLDHSTSVTGLLLENTMAEGVGPSDIDTVILSAATFLHQIASHARRRRRRDAQRRRANHKMSQCQI